MKSCRSTLVAAIAAALFVVLPAQANDTIRNAVLTKFGAKAEKVTKTEFGGLYEVVADGRIIYTDEKASFFFLGALIDGKTMQNVTGKRLFATLPFDLAVKQVRGNGKATLVTFEDPNCGYCKRLARDVQKLNDVTVYTFLFPILSEDSLEKSKAIWCSADRAKAWNNWMTAGTPPVGKKDCNAPIERLMALGQSFNVSGTPMLVFADGSRVPGAIPLEQIQEKLAEVAKKQL